MPPVPWNFEKNEDSNSPTPRSPIADEVEMTENEFAQDYRAYLLAVAESVPCTFEEAGKICARMAQRGFVWERCAT